MQGMQGQILSTSRKAETRVNKARSIQLSQIYAELMYHPHSRSAACQTLPEPSCVAHDVTACQTLPKSTCVVDDVTAPTVHHHQTTGDY